VETFTPSITMRDASIFVTVASAVAASSSTASSFGMLSCSIDKRPY
jgi:hypothetical protein